MLEKSVVEKWAESAVGCTTCQKLVDMAAGLEEPERLRSVAIFQSGADAFEGEAQVFPIRLAQLLAKTLDNVAERLPVTLRNQRPHLPLPKEEHLVRR